MTLKTVERSLLLPYSPRQMYALVNDVPSYPQFLPWCAATRVIEQDMHHMVAAVEIRKGPVHVSFSTRNQLDPDRAIHMELLDGTFRSLSGSWTFVDIAGKGMRAALRLEYDFSARAARFLLEPVFDRVCQSIMNAFARRARAVYGSEETAT